MSNTTKMKSAIMTKSKCGGEEESLEEKYQEQIRESLRMSREIRRKELEIVNLKEKCESLQNSLDRDRKLFEAEKKEWETFKDDLLLVVRAADNYKTEAVKSVEKYKQENLALEEQVYLLESKLSEYQDPPYSCRNNPVLLLETTTKFDPLPDNIVNRLDAPSPSDESTSSDYLDCVDGQMLPDVLPSNNNIQFTPLTTFENNDKENSCPVPKENIELTNIMSSQTGTSLKKFNGTASTSVNNSSKVKDKEKKWGLQDTDPFLSFMKTAGGSKRNALLRWCQNRTKGYNYVDITNFSTSWSDGMAINALLHSYLPDKVPYDTLRPENSRENFQFAFKVAEAMSIPPSLSIEDMTSNDRPSWEKVMNYVKDIYSMLENCD